MASLTVALTIKGRVRPGYGLDKRRAPRAVMRGC